MLNEKQIFPIKTATSCRLKWSWSSLILTTGETDSCHRSSKSFLTPDNFDNFHNTPEKIRDRKKMLEGKWPGHGCEYCKNLEQAGGRSDRQFQNTVPGVYPKELNKDQTLTKVKPTVIEVIFNNTCNFACIYCKSSVSSKIEQEDKKFGENLWTLHTGKKDIYKRQDEISKKLNPLFFKWLEKNVTTIQRLQILGGEPLVQKEFYDVIDIIKRYPNKELELNVVSNLNIPSKQFNKFVDTINDLLKTRSIKRFDINASVEGFGPEQEYVRYGFNTDLFNKNFEYMLNNSVFRLGFLSTITALTLKTMPRFIDQLNEWKKVKNVYWYPHMVLPIKESVLSTVNFDYEVFANEVKYVNDNYQIKNIDDKNSLDLFNGIATQIQSQPSDPQKVKDLTNFLSAVDRRRNLNWTKTFPWLKTYVGENK